MPLPSSRDGKLWLALAHELVEAGGSAPPAKIYPRMQAHFPAITTADLARQNRDGTSTWGNRIQWARQHLVDRGCIDRSQHGVWTLTARGRAWHDLHWKAGGIENSKVPKPDPIPRPVATPPKQLALTGTASKDTTKRRKEPKQPSVGQIALVDPVEALCLRLQENQRKSSSHNLFEHDLMDAFSMLGFRAKHIGGPGDTDVLVEAPLGNASYSAVVDGKSSHTGKVTDSQIAWHRIENHRQARGAAYAAVIGESFSGGGLPKVAQNSNVALITTAMLCDILRKHAAAPFTLADLRVLLKAAGPADEACKDLEVRHSQVRYHWRLIAEIVETMEKLGPRWPSGFKPDHLYFSFTTQVGNGLMSPADAPSLQDITDAMTFLSSRAVGILAGVNGSDGAFQLAMTAETARKRIRALARSLEGTSLTKPTSEAKTTNTVL